MRFLFLTVLVMWMAPWSQVSANNAIQCSVSTESLKTGDKVFRAYTRWGGNLRMIDETPAIKEGKALLGTLDLFMSRDSIPQEKNNAKESDRGLGFARVQIQITRRARPNGEAEIARNMYFMMGFSKQEFTRKDASFLQGEYRKGALRYHQLPRPLEHAVTYLDMKTDYELERSRGFGVSFLQKDERVRIECHHCFYPVNCLQAQDWKDRAQAQRARFLFEDAQEIIR